VNSTCSTILISSLEAVLDSLAPSSRRRIAHGPSQSRHGGCYTLSRQEIAAMENAAELDRGRLRIGVLVGTGSQPGGKVTLPKRRQSTMRFQSVDEDIANSA